MISLSKKLLSLCVVLALATPSYAVFDLQVTEIWPGNNPGSDLTPDWFEVTNIGDMPWTAAGDGNLYFDDDSMDAGSAVIMENVGSIAAGESVVFVDDEAAGATTWFNIWSPALMNASKPVPQIGWHAGPGLSGGGDAVTLFLDANGDGAEAGELLTFGSYPDSDSNGGQSYDTVIGAFSVVGNAAGAVATTFVNDAVPPQPAVGSPGMVAPEPTSLVLFILAGSALTFCRRRP